MSAKTKGSEGMSFSQWRSLFVAALKRINYRNLDVDAQLRSYSESNIRWYYDRGHAPDDAAQMMYDTW